MTVDGADIIETQFLKQGSWDDHTLDMLLGTARQLPHRWHIFQHLFSLFAHGHVQLAGQGARQMIGQSTYIG